MVVDGKEIQDGAVPCKVTGVGRGVRAFAGKEGEGEDKGVHGICRMDMQIAEEDLRRGGIDLGDHRPDLQTTARGTLDALGSGKARSRSSASFDHPGRPVAVAACRDDTAQRQRQA